MNRIFLALFVAACGSAAQAQCSGGFCSTARIVITAPVRFVATAVSIPQPMQGPGHVTKVVAVGPEKVFRPAVLRTRVSNWLKFGFVR